MNRLKSFGFMIYDFRRCEVCNSVRKSTIKVIVYAGGTRNFAFEILRCAQNDNLGDRDILVFEILRSYLPQNDETLVKLYYVDVNN